MRNFKELNKAVAIMIIDKTNRILVVTRKEDTNTWGFPGGKVELNETFEEALIREVKEETNFDISNYEFIPIYTGKCKSNKENVNYWTSCYFLQIEDAIFEDLDIKHLEENVIPKFIDLEKLGCEDNYFMDYNINVYLNYCLINKEESFFNK
jgi:8-oxo-dGTP pyrophosphatase MutT (NUDIX family)